MRTRIREVTKAIPWVKEVIEATLPGRATSMRPVGNTDVTPAGQTVGKTR
jgi:hypothetical protein